MLTIHLLLLLLAFVCFLLAAIGVNSPRVSLTPLGLALWVLSLLLGGFRL
jgi:hypothetical protein